MTFRQALTILLQRHLLHRVCSVVSLSVCLSIVIISPYSVAFGVILSLLFLFFFLCFVVCTVEDISTQDGAIGVKFWLRVEQTSWTGTR